MFVNIEAPFDFETDAMFGILMGIEIENSANTETFLAYNRPNQESF
jgi:hypothetical protein